MNHVPEPWQLCCPDCGNIETEDGDRVAVCLYNTAVCVARTDVGVWDESVMAANAERIVACVNACRGFSTEELAALDEKELLEMYVAAKWSRR